MAKALSIGSGIILAALHDVGKVSPGFQSKCPAWLRREGVPAGACLGQETDHAKISQKTLQDILVADGLRLWAAIVGAHHGRLKSDYLPRLADGGAAWFAERRRLVDELRADFGDLPDAPPASWDCAALWFNAGLIAVADWLASDEGTFPPSKRMDVSEIRARAVRQLERVGFKSLTCAAGKTFAELFPTLKQPRGLQAVLAETVSRPGVYVVEASMGGGKTEAALMAAYNLLTTGQATGIYFALPTQVTSNRIHKRVEAFLRTFSPEALRLIHGSSWLVETEPAVSDPAFVESVERPGRDWFASPRRALLAPYGVGTVDQALLGVVAAKHFFVRQFGLAGKVVVLDEVHSYDLYTGTLLELLVDRLRDLGATVIVLSATLTALRRQELLRAADCDAQPSNTAYPLVSANVDGRLSQKAVEPDLPRTVQVRFRETEGLAEDCLARAEGGECVLWIHNTVDEAQEAYRQLRALNRVGGPQVGLLHARFPQFRRAQLEDEWLERLGKYERHCHRPTDGCVLVSTQVVEQSVDIDADLLVTGLAPTDMLLQRIGRLWRHERVRPPGCVEQVWIVAAELDSVSVRTASTREIKAALGKSARVYAPYVLVRSYAVWRERREVTLPAEMRSLLEATYGDLPDEPAAWCALRADLEKHRDQLRRAALNNSTPWQPALDDRESVQTRWNSSPTVAVLPVLAAYSSNMGTGASLQLLNGDRCSLPAGTFVYTAAQAIHRNLVKVHRWSVAEHLSSTPRWLQEYVPGETLLCELCDGRLLVADSRHDTGLTYRDDLGVVMPSRWTRRTLDQAEEDDGESYD